MLYFIAFSFGGMFGIILMCLFQVNQTESLIETSVSHDSEKQEGEHDE